MRETLLRLLSVPALAVLVAFLFCAGLPASYAQVPSSVVVDSVAGASSWRSEMPMRSHHVVADPKTGQIVFIEGDPDYDSPVWLYSGDDGETWSSLTGFLNPGAGMIAVAADSNFTVYITYRESLPNGDIGIYFNEDPYGDGTGLGTPVLVNDTTVAPTPDYPDIAVSPGGKHIIIIAGNFPAADTVYAFVSSDGGTTWSTKVALSVYDSRVAPPRDTPGFAWDTKSIAMGSGGYAFMASLANYDSTNTTGHPLWELVSETDDYGQTWTPSWVTLPPSSEFTPAAAAWMVGSVVAVGNVPHLTHPMELPGGQSVMVEFHKEGGSWVYHTISQPDPLTGSYEAAEMGSMGVDTKGNLYCIYNDKNNSVNTPKEIFISGSSDGGDTWTPAVRLTDTLSFEAADNHWVNSAQLPVLLPDTAVSFAINGLSPTFGTTNLTTAWLEARFPLSVVWTGPYDHDASAPQPGGYGVASKGTGVYSWNEISTAGTKVTGWYNGPAGNTDAARDDGTAGPFNTGFNFTYYGKNYSHFWVSANGMMSFTDSVLNSAATQGPNGIDSLGYFSGDLIPSFGNPWNTILAPFHEDLVLGPAYAGTAPGNYGHGDVYYQTNSTADTCIIEWHNVADFLGNQTDTTLTFEVVLSEPDSSVTFMYKDVGNAGAAGQANVGIQNSDSVGVIYVAGELPISNVPQASTGVKFKSGSLTAVNERSSSVPLTYKVYQNYPNPFNPTTNIAYDLPQTSHVTVKIYNVLGQEVANLVDGLQQAGHHLVTFDGAKFASGVYFYRIRANGFVRTMKMVILK